MRKFKLIVPLIALISLGACAGTPNISAGITHKSYSAEFDECLAKEIEMASIGRCVTQALIDWYQWRRELEDIRKSREGA